MNQEENFLSSFDKQKQYKVQAKNTDCHYRLGKLKAFKDLLVSHKPKIAEALRSDFRKPALETDLTEIMPVISMINLLEKNLRSWMKDKKVKTPLLFKGSSGWVRHEGKGNCLVISPWNYPFQLSVYPVLTAFAAGNTSMVKPSEYTPNTNRIVRELFAKVFSEEEVVFFEGGAELSTELLKLPFDHVFFTGSTQVGKIVMEAAAKNLASVSLELGGKSPCLIDRSADIEKATKRIAWGKMVNSGQTCVAPDYLLVYKDQEDKVVEALKKHIHEFYPGGDFKSGPDYNQIITERHGERLESLVKDAKEKGAKIRLGGNYFQDTRSLEPTILTDVTKKMKIMDDEIFGPALPIVSVDTQEEMLEVVNSYDNALAMYLFSENQEFCDYFMDQTFSGGVTINDTLINVGHPLLPFGGAGKSGIGNYHGQYGFEEFSNLRAVMKRKTDMGASYFYPPYDQKKTGIVDSMLKKFSKVF